MRLALRDAAGNSDPDRSAWFEQIRLDSEPPSGTFLPFDPDDPMQVQLAAADDTSGISSVDVEARLLGDSTWHALPTIGSNGRYAATLDDSALPEGTYELRALLTDQAGNQRTTTTLPGGIPLTVHLPVRVGTALTVGHPERMRVKSSKAHPKYRQVLVARPSAQYGKPVTIQGRVTDTSGNPRANASVDVYEQVNLPGRDWSYLTTVRTAASGIFLYRALPGPARVLRFVQAGTATTRPSTREVELRVRAGVTIRPSRSKVVNGDDVVFRGRVLGGPIPPAGKLLAIQARTDRGWLTFATPRARALDGHWSYRYRFTGTSSTTRYTFRVLAPQETSYPYASGASRLTTVLVKGHE